MASLLDLLSQKQPSLQTRKGLILTGLQNDFLSPDGKLPVRSSTDYIARIREVVPAFRDFGDVIWVRSQYEADRKVTTGFHEAGDSVITEPLDDISVLSEAPDADRDEGSPGPSKKARTTADGIQDQRASQPAGDENENEGDADEELFLTNTSERPACCIQGTWGAEFPPSIQECIMPKDLQLVKTYYSAFGSTSLLLTLRSKLITELFVGGNMTNLSVFATAMDAARYGIKITLLEDCLGYRNKERHEAAIKTLKVVMEADVVSAAQAIEELRNPPEDEYTDDEESFKSEEDLEEEDAPPNEANAALPTDSDLEVDSDDDEDEDFDLLAAVREQIPTSRLPSRLVPPLVEDNISLQGVRQAPGYGSVPRTPNTEAGAEGPRTSDDGVGQATSRAANNRSNQNELDSGSDHAEDDSAGGQAKIDESSPSPKLKVKASLSSGRWEKTIEAELKKTQSHKDISPPPVHSSHPGLDALATLAGLDQGTVDQYEAMMKAFATSTTDHHTERQSAPLFGEENEQESAGSRILYNLLPADLAATIFDQLDEEVNWQTMHHQTGEVPRLVCCQGSIGADGSMPVYRHPSDQTLPISEWTRMVDRVRKAAEDVVGHPLNHALIQLYRSGNDFISEHSDKTLDIAKGSSIVNVSFGAQRTMRLRTKRGAPPPTSDSSTSPGRITHRVPMPHNSMITMSLATNAQYLHGINADKRPRIELGEEEKAFEGQRISLTFRNIATFLNADSTRIWGQGAKGKTAEDAKPVINGDEAESERMVRAFGRENQASSIHWDATYGEGFDVLHLR